MEKRIQKKVEKIFDLLDEAVRLLSEVEDEINAQTEEKK